MLALALALILYLTFLSTPASASGPSERPNFLFIFIDDMNMAPGSFGGQAHTPNMDRIAQEGMAFINAQTAAPACNPSRIAMLTGLRPASTGITTLGPAHTRWRQYLSRPDGPAYHHYGPGIEHVQTIFEHLHNNGYYIASTGKTFHNNDQLNAETWDEMYLWNFWPGIGWPANMPLHGMNEYLSLTHSDWGAIEDAEDPHHPGVHYSEATLPDYETTGHALDILDNAPQHQPFFIAVGYLLPHLPWYVPQSALDSYPLDAITLPETIPNDLADIPPNGVWLVWQGGGFYDQQYVFNNEHQWRKAVVHYLAGVSYVDQQVGRLLHALADKGLEDNTVIILWSDHGFHLGEKKHLRKHTLWNVATRSPLLIKAPGVTQPGSQTDSVVSATDLFPTIVDLANLEMPSDFHRDGRSLLPLLKKPETFWPWPAVTTLGRWDQPTAKQSALTMRHWRYLRYDLFDDDPDRREELYYHLTDPHEWHNLLSSQNGNPADFRGVRKFMESILRGQVKPDEPPLAHEANIDGFMGFLTPVTLSGEDPNLDFLLFEIKSLPAQGRLYLDVDGAPGTEITHPGQRLITNPGWTGRVWYLPNAGVTQDHFTFAVSDGRTEDVATVALSIHEPPRYALHLPVVRH